MDSGRLHHVSGTFLPSLYNIAITSQPLDAGHVPSVVFIEHTKPAFNAPSSTEQQSHMKTITLERPSYTTTYQITRRAWIVQDAPPEDRKRDIAFHVQGGDYFATLATIMMLVADSLQDDRTHGETPSEFSIGTLQKLKDELMHLHENYTILPKDSAR